MEKTAENEFLMQYCKKDSGILAHPKFDITTNSDVANLGLHYEEDEDMKAIWDSYADYHGWYLVQRYKDEKETESIEVDEQFVKLRKEWKWDTEEYSYFDDVITYLKNNPKQKDVKRIWKGICKILISKGWRFVESIHRGE